MNYDNNKNFNNKLIASMQLINLFIGAIIALICVVAYITIESIYIRGIIIIIAITFGIVCFVNLYNRLHKVEIMQDESNISGIELVNEDNEIIRTWDIGERISFLIGKNMIRSYRVLNKEIAKKQIVKITKQIMKTKNIKIKVTV